MSSPVLARPRRRWLRRLLLVAAPVVIVTAIVIINANIACGCEDDPTFTPIDMHQLLDRDYPAWRAAHPNAPCPGVLDLGRRGNYDGWNRPYRLTCTKGAKRRIILRSGGPDKEMGTADDVTLERPM